MKLIIGHLYPKIMNIYGDRGNIITLVRRAKQRGIGTEIHEIEVGDKISKDINLFFFGGGQDKEQILASKDLQDKKEQLLNIFEAGAAGLFICGGYQLMGKSYKPYEGTELPGVGILNVTTLAGDRRMVGNIVVELSPELAQETGRKTLVGFENHSGKTFLGEKTQPLGKVLSGNGNNGEDKTEGVFYKNVFGCYLHGPILPKNPHVADILIKRALEYKYKEKITLPPLEDELELLAHEAAVRRSYRA